MPCFLTTSPAPWPLVWLLVMQAIPGLATAARYDDGLNFSLTLGSSTTQWVYQDTPRETRLRTVTASWSQAMGPSIRGGLNLTYLDTRQATHPQAVGLDTAGDALGIDLQMQLLNTARLQLELRFGYDFARTENALEGQQIENNWTTASLGLDAELALGKLMHFQAGAGVVSVEGEEQLSGDINQLTTFNEETSSRYYAGLSIKTDDNGRIGLRWVDGYQSGLLLSFSRQY